MAEMNIGQRVQQFRKNKSMSLKDLAERTGLSQSMLSQLERGLANPSINTLKQVAEALDVALFEFFSEDASADDFIIRPQQRKRLVLPESMDVRYEFLTPDLGGSIEYCLMTLQPGALSGPYQNHKGEEVGYILQGSMTLELENESRVLFQGDSLRLPPLTRHRWRNHSGQDAQLLFAVTPPSF